MRKKTALQIPGNRKASPKQTKGLVAKDQKTRQSAQETCALDNRSHRTPRLLPNRPQPSGSQFQLRSRLKSSSQVPPAIRPVGSEAAAGGRSRQQTLLSDAVPRPVQPAVPYRKKNIPRTE